MIDASVETLMLARQSPVIVSHFSFELSSGGWPRIEALAGLEAPSSSELER